MSAQILSIGGDSCIACLVIVADSECTVDSRIELLNSRDDVIEISSRNIQISHHWIKISLSGFTISYDHITSGGNIDTTQVDGPTVFVDGLNAHELTNDSA
jgi:hypothetical protein